MPFAFLQPALLFGALAAAVPVLIHLMYQRRALVHHFPAMRFLLLADKRTSRKFRVHQWLLLALRVLTLLLLALALARPSLTGNNVHGTTHLLPQATVILVDNSLSMQYRDQSQTRLQRAKSLGTQLLHSLHEQDSAAVLPLLPSTQLASDESTSTPNLLSQDSDTWEADLSAISPSHQPTAFQLAFERAFTLLRQTSASRRRLVVISDLTANGWDTFHLSQFEVLPDLFQLHFVRVGPATRDNNVLIRSIDIAEPPFIEQVPFEITARVRNHSQTKRRNLRVDLLIGQRKVGQQLVDLPPDEEVVVPFRITAPAAGIHWGEVRLEEDAFADDDRFYFALRTVPPVHVLIVDGDPGPSLFDSEIFYLLQALQPLTASSQAMFYPTPVTWEGLPQEQLSNYQLIVLCNVEAFPPQVRKRLHQFVTSGGGLLFFAGNRIDPSTYNRMLYRSDTLLLPAPIGQSVQRPLTQPLKITRTDTAHEALHLFATDPELLSTGDFYRILTLRELDTIPGVRTLLSFDNRLPLLIEKRIGQGKVMMFTSSADRDWTDFPTRTAYVPLLHGLIGYLANLSSAAQRPHAILPAPTALLGRPEDAGATVTIRTPDGQKRLTRYPTDSPTPNATIISPFESYTVPGIYYLTTPQGPDMLSANATRAESNFVKLQTDDLQTRLRPLHIVVEEETVEQITRNASSPSQELAAMLLLIVVGLLAVENVCANRL